MLLENQNPGTPEIEIIFHDKDIVVVNKPSMLLSVPGRGAHKQDSLITRMALDFPDILTVHRLDWETSGLSVLALNKAVHRHLSIQFQNRQVHKNYIAEVYGVPEQLRGEINLPLRCDWENRPKQIVDFTQGKAAQTFWQQISHCGHTSRLLLTPITGRSHQLRVHLKSIHLPILGDRLYAPPIAVKMAARLLLHASKLSFIHPVQNQRVEFISESPF